MESKTTQEKTGGQQALEAGDYVTTLIKGTMAAKTEAEFRLVDELEKLSPEQLVDLVANIDALVITLTMMVYGARLVEQIRSLAGEDFDIGQGVRDVATNVS